jgi:hypothetical protein
VELHTDGRPDIDLRAGAADRAAFEAAALQCHEHACIPWHANVVWTSSPLAMALAAPVAALLIALRRCGHGERHDSELEEAVRAFTTQDAVGAAVVSAVREAVGRARHEPPPGASSALVRVVNLAVSGVVTDQLRRSAGLTAGSNGSAALRAMRLAVHADVRDALARTSLTASSMQHALREVIRRAWFLYVSGRHRYAFSRLYEEVWGSDVTDAPERAYQSAAAEACSWYPHREFLMASEWPCELRPELLPGQSHQPGGQALVWSDGWSVHLEGGHCMQQWIIKSPEALTVARVDNERNADTRCLLMEDCGRQRDIRDCAAETVDCVPASQPIAGLPGHACCARS